MSRELPVSEIGEGPRFYPVEVPPAPHFHPELGYLSPSPLLPWWQCIVTVVAIPSKRRTRLW